MADPSPMDISTRNTRIAVGVLLGCVIAHWAVQLSIGRFFLCIDDGTRLALAQEWALHPNTLPHYNWLPLPICWQALFLMLPGGYSPWVWSFSSLLLVVGAAVVLAGLYTRRSAFLTVSMLCLLFASPTILGLTTSALSEPLALFGLALMVRVYWSILESFTIGKLWMLTLSLMLLLGSRYESWPSTAVFWSCLGIYLCLKQRPITRWIKHYAAASLAIAVFPFGWLLLNQILYGDWRFPFYLVAQSTLSPSVGERLILAIKWPTQLAWPAMLLGMIGSIYFLRQRRWWHLLPLASVLLTYVIMFATSTVNPVYPRRFALPLLVTFLPLAVEGALLPLEIRSLRVRQMALACLMLLVFGAMGLSLNRKPLLDPAFSKAMQRLAPQLSSSRRLLLLDRSWQELLCARVLLPLGSVESYDGNGELDDLTLQKAGMAVVIYQTQDQLKRRGLKVKKARPLYGTYQQAELIVAPNPNPQRLIEEPWMETPLLLSTSTIRKFVEQQQKDRH